MTDKQENHEFSLKDLTQEIELNPNNAVAYFNRANCHNKQKNYGLALLDYNKAIELNPNYTEAYKGRSLCYEKQEEHKLASDDLKNVFMLELGFEPIDDELSLDNYTKVIESDTNNAVSYFNRAKFYNTQKVYDLALVDFTKAIELNPNYASAYYNRGICHYNQESYQRALDDLTKAIELNTDFRSAYRYRANCYYKQGNYELASDDYTKLINFAPDDDINAYSSRARCYYKQENYQLALDDLTKAIEICENIYLNDIFSHAPHYEYYCRSLCYYKQEKYNFSLTDIDNAIKFCNSLETKRRYCLGAKIIACSAKKYDKAKDYIEQYFENVDSKEQQHKDIYFQEIEKTQKIEEKNQQLQAKEKELEDMMSMFAHKFRSPLDAIIYNTSHENNPKLYAEAAQTMRGLLDIFSIISTDDKILTDKIKTDHQCNGRLITVLDKTLNMILLHLLSVSGAEKIQQHYLAYAKAHGKIDESVSYKIWCDDYFELEQELQAEWEQSFSALLNQSAPLEQRLNWIELHFFKLEIIGFERDDIQFKDYAITESFLIILINEILVNAFKYYSSEIKQPVILQWIERDGYQVLTCHNPSIRRERTTIKGSGKGHTFLSALARKTNSQFTKPKPQDDFVLEFAIPNDLLLIPTQRVIAHS